MSSPEQQGDALMRDATKASTTGLLRWSVDWEKAGRCYENAATNYQKAGSKCLSKRVKALKGAAKAAEEMGCLNIAARHLANATQALFRAGNKSDAIAFARSTASLFQQNNQVRKAADELSKAATQIRDEDASTAAELYLEAIDIFESEEQEQIGADTFRAAIALFVRKHQFSEGIDVLERQNKAMERNPETFSGSLYRNYLSGVVLCLGMREISKASSMLLDFQVRLPSFSGSAEFQAAQELLRCFEFADEGELEKVKKNRSFTYIDNEVARLVRSLEIDEAAREAAREARAAAQPKPEEEEEIDLM